jgi:hypothetical protein
MKTKLYTPTIIVGIILSYITLSYSNYLIRIDDLKDVELTDSIGNSLFQISHVLLFTSIYISNRIEKFNKLLLIPIVIQLIDLIPIELLHSLKFSLISTLSIIIGWITVMIHMYENNKKKNSGLILMGVICLLFSSIPGTLTLTTKSLSNPTGNVYKFGMKMFSLDNFNLIGETVSFHQSFSITIYSILLVFFVLSYNNLANNKI